MFHARSMSLAPLMAAVATIISTSSFAESWSGMYRITAGSYTEVGGFAGSVSYHPPDQGQAFALLATDPDLGTASLKFLQENQRTGSIQFTNGVISDNTIRFQYETINPYSPTPTSATVDYTV